MASQKIWKTFSTLIWGKLQGRFKLNKYYWLSNSNCLGLLDLCWEFCFLSTICWMTIFQVSSPGKGLVAWFHCILHLTLNDVNVVSLAYMSTVELSSEEIGYGPEMNPEVPLGWQGVDLKNTGIHSLSKLRSSFKIWLKPHNITFQYLEISKKFVSKLFLHLQREQCHRHEGNWKT